LFFIDIMIALCTSATVPIKISRHGLEGSNGLIIFSNLYFRRKRSFLFSNKSR